MPNPTPSARYDTPWKAAITFAFRAFITFFFPDLCIQIDWSKRPRFRDKELAGISFSGTPGGLIADKLVEVCLLNSSRQWILVHIEVQAQRDAHFARRVYDYNYRIHKEHARPVVSLALLADDDPNWRPDAWHSQVQGTATTFYFTAAKLLDFAGQTDELQASHNPFAWITLVHLRTQQARHDVNHTLCVQVAAYQATVSTRLE